MQNMQEISQQLIQKITPTLKQEISAYLSIFAGLCISYSSIVWIFWWYLGDEVLHHLALSFSILNFITLYEAERKWLRGLSILNFYFWIMWFFSHYSFLWFILLLIATAFCNSGIIVLNNKKKKD